MIRRSKKRLKKEKKKNSKISRSQKKATISSPQNFLHFSHSGLEGNFEIETIPPEYKALFKKLGISKAQIKDPETKKEILSAIENVLVEETKTHGEDAVNEKLQRLTKGTSRSSDSSLPPPPPTPPPTPLEKEAPVHFEVQEESTTLVEDSVDGSETQEEVFQTDPPEVPCSPDDPAQDNALARALKERAGGLRQTPTVSVKRPPRDGKDAAMDMIKDHGGLTALKHVERISRGPIEDTSLEGALADSLVKFRVRLREDETDDEESDWSSDDNL